MHGGSVDRHRHQPFEPSLAAGRHLPIALAFLQSAEPPLDLLGVRISERGKALVHALAIGVVAGVVPDRREVVRLCRRGDEDLVEVARHGCPMRLELLAQRFVVRASHAQRYGLPILGGARQRVGLLVVQILQAVLEIA
jgi:hypothetical protein